MVVSIFGRYFPRSNLKCSKIRAGIPELYAIDLRSSVKVFNGIESSPHTTVWVFKSQDVLLLRKISHCNLPVLFIECPTPPA
jgi:hypothetical protein